MFVFILLASENIFRLQLYGLLLCCYIDQVPLSNRKQFAHPCDSSVHLFLR